MSPHDPSRYPAELWAGVLLSAAVFTIIDETILHLLLHWHHFYDRASPGFALTSDGIFQAVGIIALVSSGYLVADLRRRQVWRPVWLATGLALGLASSASSTKYWCTRS